MSKAIVPIALFALLLCSLLPTASAAGWDKVDQILKGGISSQTTPGIQALVADRTGIIYHKTFGSFTYGKPTPINGKNPPVTFDTIFDMASLTKVLATTTTAMMLYDKGVLNLDMKISHPSLLGANYAVNGKGPITVRNLLLHNSGLAPGPYPGYGDIKFGCPETSKHHPQLSYSCMGKIFQSVLQEKARNPVGAVYTYSDLSMITGALAFGRIIKDHNLVAPKDLPQDCMSALSGPPQYTCYFQGFVRHQIVNRLKMANSGFILPKAKYPHAIPAWNDTTYRHALIQGVVSDTNAYASGGYAGHAGFWSTTTDTYILARELLLGSANPLVKPSTVQMFTKVANLTQSSRALGWDTNDYKMHTYNGCGTLSPKAYSHLGYTGTQNCNDPDRKLITILLTNRVYNAKSNSADLIKALRQQFNTAVQQVYDSRAFSAEIQESVPLD